MATKKKAVRKPAKKTTRTKLVPVKQKKADFPIEYFKKIEEEYFALLVLTAILEMGGGPSFLIHMQVQNHVNELLEKEINNAENDQEAHADRLYKMCNDINKATAKKPVKRKATKKK